MPVVADIEVEDIVDCYGDKPATVLVVAAEHIRTPAAVAGNSYIPAVAVAAAVATVHSDHIPGAVAVAEAVTA